ncbi:MAG: putative PEP-binding protein, partial [Oscillospiraceae bacterium]
MILRGNPVSPGVAVGKVYVYQPFHVQVAMSVFPAELAGEQLERYDRARCNAARELQSLYQEIHSRDREQAGIFDAHRQIMEDEELDGSIRKAILEEHLSPDWAIYKIYEEYISLFQDAADAVTRERADDLKDLRTRLLRNWYGIGEVNLSRLSEPLVVVAHDLLPSDTATLDRQKVLGILTERGGGTSHAAIIARSYGIPAVMGIDGLISSIAPDSQVAVDALAGEVTLFPSREQIREAEEKRAHFLGERAKTSEYLLAPPRMADGVRIEVGLNLNSDSDEELAAAPAVDSVGLTRTEFLYSGRIADEESQLQVYKKILRAFGGKPVTVRTLDIGGDNPMDRISGSGEPNPFQGNRGIRFCLDHPQLLRTQYRAAQRAS